MILLANRVLAETSKPFNQTSKGTLFQLYREAFGDLNGLDINCGSCKHDAFTMLKIWLKNSDKALLNSKLNLFTSHYKDKSDARQKELDFCLNQNKNSGLFENIIVVQDRRPTYNDLFELTRQYPNSVNIIANSDIFFNDTILQAKYIKQNQCFALSRWDYVKGGTLKHFKRADSQDVWIVRGGSLVTTADFYLGVPGCDNRIAHEFKSAGYDVTNPSISIRTNHLHLSQIHNYTSKDTVPKPYYFPEVCSL